MIELLEPRQLLSTYYVDATGGNDANTGKSPRAPWLTLTQVNAHLRKGDKVFLTGTFTNQMLTLNVSSTINSYSYNSTTKRTTIGGSATIAVSQTDGVQISASKVTLENLNITSTSFADGVALYTDGVHLVNSGSATLTGDIINHVIATGFSYGGLVMEGWNSSASNSAGFSNVTIENSIFSGNAVSGIFVGAGDSSGMNFIPGFPADLYLNSNLTIKNCQTFNNAGFNPLFANLPDSINPNDGNATNGGIFISSVNGAVVENCTSYNNCFASLGGVGIWAFDATRVNFLSNDSDDNKTMQNDGDGFDFDHGVTNSIMQYDFAHGNDGAGFLLSTNGGTSNDNNDTIRYSISDDDGQQNSFGGISIYNALNAPVLNANIYNNTVLVGSAVAGTPSAVMITGDAASSSTVSFLNNILYTTGSDPLIVDDGPSTTTNFKGNDYWASSAATTFNVVWGASTYTSLSDWRTASGQETSTGQNEDPMLVSETVSDSSAATGLSVSKTSPLLKQGLNLTSKAFHVAPYNAGVPYNLAGTAWGGLGKHDFFNHAVDRLAIGAG